MLRLEEFMDVRKLYQEGLSISAIARQLGRDRKTVQKYLEAAPQPYRRGPREWKVDAYRSLPRVLTAEIIFTALRPPVERTTGAWPLIPH